MEDVSKMMHNKTNESAKTKRGIMFDSMHLSKTYGQDPKALLPKLHFDNIIQERPFTTKMMKKGSQTDRPMQHFSSFKDPASTRRKRNISDARISKLINEKERKYLRPKTARFT